MIKVKCNHIRIRDNSNCIIDVKNYIKYIETEYKIDFKSIPQWKDIIKRIQVTTTECKRKIQAAKYRKALIIEKLFKESTRATPFELTENLSRTAERWRMLEMRRKKTKTVFKIEPEIDSELVQELKEISGESSDLQLTAHPNTEIFPSEELITEKVYITPEKEKIPSPELSHLPMNISVNQHKLISPLNSKHDVALTYKITPELIVSKKTSEEKEWLLLSPTLCIKSRPQKIIITNDSLDVQVAKFSLSNISNEYLNVRFVHVIETSSFRWAKISPMLPCKLYPGLQVLFTFTYKLSQNTDDFNSSLFFRVGEKVLFRGSQLKSFCIPIESKFKVNRSVSISEAIFLSPAYQWNLKEDYGYPTDAVKISVNDDFCYNLRILKRNVNFVEEFQDSSVSAIPVTPNTESLKERIDEVEAENKPFVEIKNINVADSVKSIKSIDIISFIVMDVIELALSPFLFQKSYWNLQPRTNYNIPVYLTKAERVGSHHSYYDFQFADPDTDDLLFTKTVKIFAEVLPHPVQISPEILDMSTSPITYGFCEDYIVIRNTHKVYPVSVNIHLNTKMRKLFCITPKTTSILANSEIKFIVTLCSSSLANKSQNLVHFTIKIVVSGYKPIYGNAPPLFYEIIAPCKLEYHKVYNTQYLENVFEQDNQQ